LLNRKADLFGFGVMGILCHRHKQNDPENTKGDAFLHPLFHVPVLGRSRQLPDFSQESRRLKIAV